MLLKTRSVALKGQCHKIFDPQIFSSNNPPGALIHGLNPFCIWLLIRRENRFGNRQNQDSAVSMRPQKPIPRSHWDRRNLDKNFHVGSLSLIETIGSNMKSYAAPAVNNRKYVNKIENFCHTSLSLIRPRNLWQKCLWPTTETDPAASLRPRNPIRRSHRDGGIQTLQTIILIFSAKTKPYAKRL
jgi:hypothetical protein